MAFKGVLNDYQKKRLEEAKFTFIQLAKERGFVAVSQYQGSKHKVTMFCSVGHKFYITPTAFKGGQGCAKCAGLCPKQAKEQFLKMVEERSFKVFPDSYVNDKTKIDITCPLEHKFFIRPNDFKQGHGCPKCSNQCPVKSKDRFLELAKERHHIVDSEYINDMSKVCMTCPNNHKFSIAPNCFKQGRGCRKCADQCPEQAKERFLKIAKERGFEVLEHRGNTKKADMICPKGHRFSIRPANFKRDQGCSLCVDGYGNQDWFDNRIRQDFAKVESEATVPGRHKMSYDIVIYINETIIAVEIDGRYHKIRNVQIEYDWVKGLLSRDLGIKMIRLSDENKGFYIKNKEQNREKAYQELKSHIIRLSQSPDWEIVFL